MKNKAKYNIIFLLIISFFLCDLSLKAQPNYDAGITAISQPSVLVGSNTHDVKVNLKNYSTFNLTTVDINWEVNGVPQITFSWNGNLAQNATASNVTINSFNFASGQYVIKAWTTNPNGGNDINNTNDTSTLIVDVCQPLQGTYTIGGTGADFASFTQAFDILHTCGISDDVILDVTAATYAEQLTIQNITGTSTSSTITIKGNNATLTFTPTVNDKRYVMLLNGAKHLFIDSLNVIVPNNATYGWNILLTNSCEDITLKNCTISTHSSSATTNFAGIVASASMTSPFTEGSNIRKFNLINNYISGGYFGMRLNGENANKMDSLIISQCTFSNNYYHGIYLNYAHKPVLIDNLIDIRSTGAFTNFGSGTTIENTSGIISFLRNRIINAGQYALFIKNNDAGTERSTIANNMLGGGFRHANASGIYLESVSKADIYFNSINVNTASARAINVTANTTSLNVKNNSFAYTGAANGFCAYYASTASLLSQDYNNYFNNGSLFVYYGDTIPNITSLRAVNIPANNDMHSRVGNPYYISTTDLHSDGIQLYQRGTGIPAISDDIDGDLRPAQPCIGADEYVPALNDLAVVEWVSPKTGCALSNTEEIVVKILNYGGNPQSNFPIAASIDAGTTFIGPEIVPDLIQPGDTLIYTFTNKVNLSIPGTYYSGAVVLLQGDEDHSNDTIINIIESVPYINNYPYKEVFDWYSGWIPIALTGTNQWELGMPNQSVINSALSGMNMRAYMTKLNANYDDNVVSSLVSPCFDLSPLVEPIFSVWLNIKTEPNNDAMILQSSVDGGNTWTKITGTTGFYNNNSSIGALAPPKWSGSNSHWTQYKTSILSLAGETDVRFRFLFNSNIAVNDEGIAIDEIMIYDPPPHDVGVLELIKPDSAICGTVEDSLIVVIKNYGINTQTSIPVNVIIQSPDSTFMLFATYSGNLQYNSTDTLFVGLINTTTNGNYIVKAYTTLPADTIALDNDTAIYNFYINTPLPIPYYENFENQSVGWLHNMNIGTDHFSFSKVLYKNLNTSNTFAYAQSPKIGTVGLNSVLYYDYRYVDYASPLNPYVMDVTDTLKVFVSDDCGLTFILVDTVHYGNHFPDVFMKTRNIPLTGFFGNDIIIRFEAVKNNLLSYYIDLDNVLVSGIPIVNLGNDTSICEGSTLLLDAQNYTVNTLYSWFTDESPTEIGNTQTLTVTAPATYIVVVDDGFGNTGTDTITVDYKYNPLFSIGNDFSICSGEAFLLHTGQVVTPLLIGNLNDGLPLGWTTYNGGLLDIVQTIDGGFLLLDSDEDTIITRAYDLSSLNDIKLDIDIAGFGTGQNNYVTILVSEDNGLSWIHQFDTDTTTNDTVYTTQGLFDISSNTTQVVFKLFRPNTAGKGVRLRNFRLLQEESNFDVLWQDNTANDTLLSNSQGIYWAMLTNNDMCSSTDSITVSNYPDVIVELGTDTLNICTGENLTLDAGSEFVSFIWQDNSTNQLLTVNTEAMYKVEVENIYGCTSSDSVYVVVDPAPFVTLPNDTAICLGTSVTIDAGFNADYSYIWHELSSADTLSVSSTLLVSDAGIYIVVVDNGCTTKATDTINIALNIPQQVILPADTLVCYYDTLSIDAGAGFINYLWFNNANTQSIELTASGTIYEMLEVYITTIDNNYCVSSDTMVVEFDLCVGENRITDSFVKIYPNPTQKYLNIDFFNKKNDFYISIFSIEGVKLYEEKISATDDIYFKKSLNLAAYKKGIYFINISDKNHSLIQKLIIY